MLPLGFTSRLPIFSYLLDQCQLLLVFGLCIRKVSAEHWRITTGEPQCSRAVAPKDTRKKTFPFLHFLIFCVLSVPCYFSKLISLLHPPWLLSKILSLLEVQPRQNINTILISFVKKELKREQFASAGLSNLFNVST